ncbi:acyl-CoA reductase [Magnetospirillum sulfuroxidans]|uniref:Long-chain-fatty-acyl-CoA reductase n=1 Tax=Magnetospirillum sulfuroxidans TaxID=611300 RepID=A0ABS5IAB2_9PROT|nr:acyl-CoA reductase [Magnetospirillum sulfuroxidans]MBR9971353.1 hypothetical protein [Magnetospirillum sulfuroxidans]
MSAVTRLDGPGGTIELTELEHWFAGPAHACFAETTVALGQEISRSLLADADLGRRAEVVALAFFLRQSHSRRLIAQIGHGLPDRCLAVPRGRCLVFAPGNVDTMFVYSWWLALLAGNRVAVRLTGQRSALTDSIVAVLARVLAQPAFAVHAAATRLLSWPHDDAAGAALSGLCDLRVIWGGDASIAAIRSHALGPAATEVTFPDRRSLAVFAASAYLSLEPTARDRLIRGFAADLSAFDQMACSSPRLLVWCGPDAEPAAADFRPRLGAVLAQSEPAIAMRKLVNAARAVLDGPEAVVHRFDAGLLVLKADGAEPDHCGGGMLAEWRIDGLEHLADLLDRRYQTLVHFGFDGDSLRQLARRLNGRALDRMMPVGKALEFASVWDGHDLLRAALRLVWIEE